MRKPIAIATIAGSLIGGTALGAIAFGPPSVSGADPGLLAQEDPDTTTEDTTATDETTADDDRGNFLEDALAPLVEDGTITQEQADAVIAAIQEAKPDHVFFPGRIVHGLDVVAETLGIEESALRDELEAGKTVAEVATERGVDVQTVIDAIVAEGNARIDEAVAEGNLTEEQAADIREDLTEIATDLVNGELPEPGGFFPRGPGHPRGPGVWFDDETETDDSGG